MKTYCPLRSLGSRGSPMTAPMERKSVVAKARGHDSIAGAEQRPFKLLLLTVTLQENQSIGYA